MSCATKYRVNASDPAIVLAFAASGMFGSVVATVDVVEDGAVVAEVDVEAADVDGPGLEVALDPEAPVDVPAGVVDAVGGAGEVLVQPASRTTPSAAVAAALPVVPRTTAPSVSGPATPGGSHHRQRADGAPLRKPRATKYPSPAVSGKSPSTGPRPQWDLRSRGTRECPAPETRGGRRARRQPPTVGQCENR